MQRVRIFCYVLFILGLTSFISGYYVHLSNASIFGEIAIQNSGAMIMLEHRFFGESNPYPDLSVESLRVHTVQQAIDDFEYFSKHVVLPMPGGDSVGPDKAPWVVAGGSYSGALAAWAMQKYGFIFTHKWPADQDPVSLVYFGPAIHLQELFKRLRK
jgi:hypothetical protein